MRHERYMHHHRLISEHNDTESNFKLGHNQFSDWTDAEYEAILGYKGPENEKIDNGNVEVFDEPDLPDYINWVEAGFDPPVRDQGRCGSCWAFSAIGALEGAHFAATKELLSLSEQQLIDCSGFYDCYTYDFKDYCLNGCHGGNQIAAFKYFQDGNKFAMFESDYPYTSGAQGDDSTNCLYQHSKTTNVTVFDWKLAKLAYTHTIKADLQKMPLAVAISANNIYIHSYTSGIIDGPDCGFGLYNGMNHAVLLVGYGTDEATGFEYWLLKNSWNTTWGDKGYFKIKFDDGYGYCNVQTFYAYPILK